MDGLVYGVVVSLGFATYENYAYVYEWAEQIAKEEGIILQNYLIMSLGRSYSTFQYTVLMGCNGLLFWNVYFYREEKL